MKKRKKKKLSKNKRKFFIWASCYLAVFLITAILTASTLSWFAGSTWQDGEMYMGGPVYISIGDDKGIKTMGENSLTTETPPGWQKLYPGMNIHFEARAILENDKRPNHTTIPAVSSAVMRAKVMLEIIDKQGHSSKDIDKTSDPEAYERINLIYNSIWVQLKAKAQLKEADNTDPGFWLFHLVNPEEQENYFYYVTAESYTMFKNGTYTDVTQCIMEEVGKEVINDSVGFLNDAIVTIPGVSITNEYAECRLIFTVSFQALQAFFGHNDDQTEKPLTVSNSIPIYTEASQGYYTES